MSWLLILLFVFFSQDCSQLGKCLPLSDTSFFTPYLFRDIGGNGASNYADILPKIKAFDFKKIHNSSDYEGVILKNNGKYDFLQRTTALTYSKSLCDCKNKALCSNCLNFKRKLRSGIFYGGPCRVYRQDSEGNVFVDQCTPKGELLTTRFLFKNFKEIIQVQMGKDDNVVFVTENTYFNNCLAYDYNNHKKSVNLIQYSDLKTIYADKFPWMKEYPIKNKDLNISDGNLVIESVHFPLWASLAKKIVFLYITDMDQTHGLVFLKTDQGVINAFRLSDKQFFSINTEATPAYDSHDVSRLDRDVYILTAIQPIKQSCMGWYFGAYLFMLKRWVVCLKNRFMKIFPNRV